MKIEKKINDMGYNDIYLKFENAQLIFELDPKGNLYWRYESGGEYSSIVINQENYMLYSLFDALYYNIENVIYRANNSGRKKEYTTEEFMEIQKYGVKTLYQKTNKSHYNEIFDENSHTITWHSDDNDEQEEKILYITKMDDIFVINFFCNKSTKYLANNSSVVIPILFKKQRSYYEPFNRVFINIYKSMKNIDNIDDMYHQILIGEYIYSQKTLRKN